MEGEPNGARPDMQQVTTLPRGTKVKEVAFTDTKMFVLSTTGEVYIYNNKLQLPKHDATDIYTSANAGKDNQIIGLLSIEDSPKKI